MVKIYTRTGDQGKTSLYGGKRVLKSHPRVNAYGTVDELNSHLGLLLAALSKEKEIINFLTSIQSDLFVIGSHLSGDKIPLHLLSKRIRQMENLIDRLDKNLPPLKNFILPLGSPEASLAHIVRTVCRRSERQVIALISDEKSIDLEIVAYLNRLSDLMFIIARYLNSRRGIKDVIWKKLL
ncbi:ATP:cob(I)alamin adenosyltransferase [Candidatus Gottesmanbacteria bacterium RBG_16_37_8]|uniref:Corrinoid adenosyltransferase n=1 Tax=Candidatus Gottesmanbacteria bacterium RBG_16_37_8 TaxID=1798371 RepID=A0A1F5YV24_9BACT|nr:MAG: ATP:cob(I)alamin adenosyltransferase [Candidatus Gottesmanbacteria bacterium RBG_16_37_8]